MDQRARRLASHWLAFGHPRTASDLLAQSGALCIAGCRCSLLSSIHPQLVAPGTLPASQSKRIARGIAAPAGGDRLELCDALHAGAVRASARECAPLDR